MKLENIPAEMKFLPHWICWKTELREGKQTKVPYRPDGKGMAASNNPETWTTFEQACFFAKLFDGIGFMAGLEPSGIILLDLDDCIVDGEPATWAAEILATAQSYTELSPSGEGYHVYFNGKLPGPSKKVNDAEIYDRTRYFTVTGNIDFQFKNAFRKLSDEETAKIYSFVLNRKLITKPEEIKKPIIIQRQPILERMFASRNGSSIQALYNGDTSSYAGDQSAADSALCFHLAFWTNKNSIEIDNLFRASRLMRDKWDKRHSSDGRTYGQMTIDRALENCSATIADNIQKIEQVEHTADGRNLAEVKNKQVSITKPAEYLEGVEKLYTHGRERGYSLPWPSMRKYMQIVRGLVYVFTGYPGCGKTELMFDIAEYLASKYNLKWAMFSPENYPGEEMIANLIEKKTKKPFFGGERLSLETAKETVNNFINNHFVLLGERDESVALDGILSAINDIEFDGLMIDPYNELESSRPANISMTEFVGQNLMRLRRFGKLKNKIIFISAHPTKQKRDDNGNYKVSELYDIADSAHWRNKADFGISVFRNEETHYTDIHIQKVRFRHYGELGNCALNFDKMCGSFYEINGDKKEW